MANNPYPYDYPYDYIDKLPNYKAVILCLDMTITDDNEKYIDHLSKDNYSVLHIKNHTNSQDIIISIDDKLLFNIKDELLELVTILDSKINIFESGVTLNNKEITNIEDFNKEITLLNASKSLTTLSPDQLTKTPNCLETEDQSIKLSEDSELPIDNQYKNYNNGMSL